MALSSWGDPNSLPATTMHLLHSLHFPRAWLACGLLALAGAASAQVPTAAPAAPGGERAGIAKVIKGQVAVSDGRTERALAPGDSVSAADRISTGADSSASMVLRDGTTVVLGPNSRMELREFTFDSTTYQGNVAVHVLRGTMRMLTGLIGKTRPGAVTVGTPTTLIGIRGTDFIVDVEEAVETK